MKNYKIIVFIALVLTGFMLISGCQNEDSDAKTMNYPYETGPESEKVRDAGETPVGSGIVSVNDADFFCRYDSPFAFGSDKTQPECKAYSGTYWTKAGALADCMLPFGPTFDELNSQFSTTPCETESALATCTADADYDNVAITLFYQVMPPPAGDESGLDLAIVRAGCEGFGGGIYEGAIVEAKPSSPLLPEALTACSSTVTVEVTPDNITDAQVADYMKNGGYIFFRPKFITPAAGLIIYPGGLIDPRAFAPAAQILADNGIAVAVLPVPDYMAISEGAQERPTAVIDAPENSAITHWFIAGHSVGAVAAAMYTFNQVRPLDGLVVLGSYLSSDQDLSGRTDLSALIMIGGKESLATEGTSDYDNFQAGKEFAPPDTTYLVIDGGIHFGFCYQENPREGEVPAITVAEQHAQYTGAIINMIDTSLSGK